jgi:hypothetical protein
MPGLLVSPDGVAGSLPIHSDTFLHLLAHAAGERRRVSLEPGRHAWIQVASGGIRVNGLDLKSGDGAAVSGEKDLEFESSSDSRVLVFDLA